MQIEKIQTQQAEEGALLWLRRDLAVAQPHYSLADLAKLDHRLEGHLDGLRIAGQAGWAAAEGELRWREPAEVFTAAVLAFESGNETRIDRVLELGLLSEEFLRPLVSALGWLSLDRAKAYINRFIAGNSAALRYVGIAAAAVHRYDTGRSLLDCMTCDDSLLQARALRAAGELGRVDLLRELEASLDAADIRVRSSAAWSMAILTADAGAEETLLGTVEERAVEDGRTLPVVLYRMRIDQAVQWIRDLESNPNFVRLATRAAGLLGTREFVPSLLERMRTAQLARLAGEALSTITGASLARDGLEGTRPEGFESGPSEDPADDHVEMDADENLPWPDQEKIATWWKKHKADFVPATRYLLGRPITEEWLEHVLRHGLQRQRAAAALELAIRRPGTPLFEVRAPGFRQQELLG